MTRAEAEFLERLGIKGPEMDEVDVEYLKEVHWELWEEFS